MFEALITIFSTALSKGIPVLLSVTGRINKEQISEFLAATAVMQIFILGVGLGQTASLSIDFFRGKLLRHITLSAGIILILVVFNKKAFSLVLIAWMCSCAQLAYQFIENRMKLLSLYALGRQAAIFMLLTVIVTVLISAESRYYRLIIQYLPLVVFSVYALLKYYGGMKNASIEVEVQKGRSFDYVLCAYAFCSTFSLVVERQFYANIGGALMEAYFWAINAGMILTFVQDYVVKSRFFDDAKYTHYGWAILLLASATGLISMFLAATAAPIILCLLLLYLAQNAFFSMYIKRRQVGVAIVLGAALVLISLAYYLVARKTGDVMIVSGIQWLASTSIGVAMVLYGKKGHVNAAA